MTENQDAALHALRNAKHWMEKLAHLDDNEPMNPVLKKRCQQEAESLQRLYAWLFAWTSRGDEQPGEQKPVDNPQPKA